MYAVSGCGPSADLAFRSFIVIRFGRTTNGGGLRVSAADGGAVCQEDYYIRLFDFVAMDPMFHAVFHACHGGQQSGRCLDGVR